MRVLLDTCVLSELRRSKGNAGVRRAVEALADESLFISVVSVGEIVKGIALLRDTQHRRALEAWLQTLERHYADRLLPLTLKPAASGENLRPPRRKPAGPSRRPTA